jgi:hypothetical protein
VTFRQVIEEAQIVASTTAQAIEYNFTLASLDNASNLTALFDQYRISCIRLTITPDNNAIPIENATTTALVPLYCVIDYDDSTALASAAAARAYDNCAIVEPSESCCRTFAPRVALAAYAGAFTNYANQQPMWLDTVSTGVQHYGVKLYVPAIIAGQTFVQSWHVTAEYWISLRSVK